jgi:uncharacterized membrane protein
VTRRTALVAVLSLLGLAVAGYLTSVHYGGTEPICTAGGSCEQVQTSRYAELGGIPVALLGVVGYAAILGSLAVPGHRGRLLRVLLAAVGFGFSAYLTYLELFVIDAICQWCVASAAIMAALLVVAVGDFLEPVSEPRAQGVLRKALSRAARGTARSPTRR